MAGESKRTIKMNANFRLFATQNPNSGLFKGKREQLSQSLLSRFLPVTFNELPEAEWQQIVQRKFYLGETDSLGDFFVEVAEKLVAFHTALSKLHDGRPTDPAKDPLLRQLQRADETRAPFAVFSIRDLLQVVMHVNLDRCEWPDMEILALKEQICFQARRCLNSRPVDVLIFSSLPRFGDRSFYLQQLLFPNAPNPAPA